MNKETFTNRVISLTGEKVLLDYEYARLRERLESISEDNKGRATLKRDLKECYMSIEHCENNIKLNKFLSGVNQMLSLKITPARNMYIKVIHKVTGDSFKIYVGESSKSQIQVLLDGDRETFEYYLVKPDREVAQ